MTFASTAMAGSFTPAPSSMECADFLSVLHLKPPHVQFIKCEFIKDKQGKPLKAFYRVAGTHAAEAEAFFIRTAHLPRRKISCCQWDGMPGYIKDKDDRIYDVWMVSEETTVSSRRQ
jgi:hypothetical protein